MYLHGEALRHLEVDLGPFGFVQNPKMSRFFVHDGIVGLDQEIHEAGLATFASLKDKEGV